MSSGSRVACPAVDAPRRARPAVWDPAGVAGAHRRVGRRALGPGCGQRQDVEREWVVVGRAPRAGASAAGRCLAGTAGSGAGLGDQLANGLALLAAVVTLLAAIWWTACAPAL